MKELPKQLSCAKCYGGGGGKGGGAYGSATVPEVPPFNPIDIPAVADEALATDETAYGFADKDIEARFPGLVRSRRTAVTSALKGLTSPLDPTLQNTFAKDALAKAFQTTGGGTDTAVIGGPGSADRGGIAASIASSVLSKQDADRKFLDDLLTENPQRAFGISGKNAVQFAIANNIGLNNYRWQKYVQQITARNARIGQLTASTAAVGQVGSSIFSGAQNYGGYSGGAVTGYTGKGGTGGGGEGQSWFG